MNLQQEDQREYLSARKRHWQTFLASNEWKEYSEALNTVLLARRNALFETVIGDMSGAFLAAQVRGEVAGLQVALKIPELMIQDFASRIDSLDYEREISP